MGLPRLAALGVTLVGALLTRGAHAELLPAEARADQVSLEPRSQVLELDGHVRVESPPFYLSSDHVRLRRTRFGIEVVGDGQVAFCPCLGTPLALRFREATLAPPGDVFLTGATLRLFGAPVLYTPWFWLRSSERPGLLPPDLALRGRDGLYAGGGAHLPWKARGGRAFVDLRAGGYTAGGAATEAKLVLPGSRARVRFDHLRTDGLAVDARGAAGGDGVGAAWDVDALRGARAVRATTDVDAAARPWDRGRASVWLASGDVVVDSGVRAVAARGGSLGGLDAGGVTSALRLAHAVGDVGNVDGLVEAGVLAPLGAAAPGAPLAQGPRHGAFDLPSSRAGARSRGSGQRVRAPRGAPVRGRGVRVRRGRLGGGRDQRNRRGRRAVRPTPRRPRPRRPRPRAARAPSRPRAGRAVEPVAPPDRALRGGGGERRGGRSAARAPPGARLRGHRGRGGARGVRRPDGARRRRRPRGPRGHGGAGRASGQATRACTRSAAVSRRGRGSSGPRRTWRG